MRAPLAMLPDLWGGGELAVFRAAGIPCLLAGVALGVVLAGQMLARSAAQGDDRHRRLPLRRQPDHAARARHRPSRGAARRRALRRRRARRAARALDAGRGPARPGRRQQGLGAARRRARAARAAGRSAARAGDRRRDRGGVHGAVAAGRLLERAPGRRGRDRRDLPALAGVVVPRLDRRGDPRQQRAHQGGLPGGPGLGVTDQPPADRRGGGAALAAGVAPSLGSAAAAGAAVRAAVRARPVEHGLLRAAGDPRARRVGGDELRPPAAARARDDHGDVGDLGVGRSRRRPPTSRRSSTSPGPCRSSPSSAGGSTRPRSPRSRRSAPAAGRASGAPRSSAP